MRRERNEKSLSKKKEQLALDRIKQNSLLSLFGSRPPIRASTQKDWDDIREKARNERFHPNNDSV